MEKFWRSKSHFFLTIFICYLYLLNFNFCSSLNDEGVALLRVKEKVLEDPHGALSNWHEEVGVETPCSWFGVECSEGSVIILNLKDLCLRGTLDRNIGELTHMKAMILRNNSFFGAIPEEIINMEQLEVLDIGCNNFSGQLPYGLGNNFSMAILLLDNNELLGSTSPEIYELQRQSEIQVEENILSSTLKASSCNYLFPWTSGEIRHVAKRQLLQDIPAEPSVQPNRPGTPTIPLPQVPQPSTRSPFNRSQRTEPSRPPTEPPRTPTEPLRPPVSPNGTNGSTPPNETLSSTNSSQTLILSAAIVGPLLLLFLVGGILFWQRNKVATVKPWATGLSGQLQRALVSGVPKLKRSELEAACEDFSNVIGSLSACTLYKGTLSSVVEIAVASVAVMSKKDWSSSMESQFRKKIVTLSKVNHKNFVSLIGYCVEEEPFTRMMVFEYAPNGTLFEHLHIKEAEPLDWLMRIRIAMGMAYCLEHMHHLTPPLPHRNLTSSAVYLTEDYAAKISDLISLDEGSSSDKDQKLQNNIYSFGVVLFEMMTGKLPYSSGSDTLEDWASDYLIGDQPLRELVDPNLQTYQEYQLKEIEGVIRACVNPNPSQRPLVREVCERLRDITRLGPDEVTPKLSPLWWAELEILSTEAS